MEGSSPPGSYVTLDHGRRLCMTVAVENEIYPWTEGERQPRQREYPGIVEPWRGASYEAPGRRKLSVPNISWTTSASLRI